MTEKALMLDKKIEEQERINFLLDLYDEVRKNYKPRASNGGELPPLPENVTKGEISEVDISFTINALHLLKSRYLSRDANGKIIETPEMMLRRVTSGFEGYTDTEELFRILAERRFFFNSPTLFNMYKKPVGTLSACYVTPIYDDMASIMESARVQALTFKYGGGQGFNFSNLRPRGSIVKGTSSQSSGSLSFIEIYNTVTETVKQGGKRRGANMGMMSIWHPDIYNPDFDVGKGFRSKLHPIIKQLLNQLDLERLDEKLKGILKGEGEMEVEEAGFIQAKESVLGDIHLTNFNLSVVVNDAFMDAVLRDDEWIMVNPQLSGTTTRDGDYRILYTISEKTGKGAIGEVVRRATWIMNNPFFNIYEDILLQITSKLGTIRKEKNPIAWKIRARVLWEKIVLNAWTSGDPGLFFQDNHNKYNPTPWLSVVVATNPCISGDTMVLTPNGERRAEDLFREAVSKGNPIAILVDREKLGRGGDPRGFYTSVVSLVNGEMREAIGIIWYVGKKEGLKVRTESGREIVVTREHKFLTHKGWKPALELEEGDAVYVYDRGIKMEPVVEVSPVGEVDFFDISVPGYHVYVANGFVNHNCGEQPLYPFESCNLGSISIDKYVDRGRFNLDDFYKDIMTITDAMDAIIDLNKHPDPRQTMANRLTRKIGLGLMGLADALVKLGIPYDSDEAVAFTMIITAGLEVFSWKRSWELARDRGVAPAFRCRMFDWVNMKCLEEGDPCELADIHIPALEKQRYVRFDDDWVRIRYHDVVIPEDIYSRLNSEVREHVSMDGSVKLVRVETVKKILREIFSINPDEDVPLDVSVVNDPRKLLLLAVFNPSGAWRVLRDYGKSLGVCAPRNTVMTTVAPTGSISILAGTSSGIEPYFAIVFKRRITIGEFIEMVRLFRDKVEELKSILPKDDIDYILEKISVSKGSIRMSRVWEDNRIPVLVVKGNHVVNVRKVLEDLAKLFPTSLDISIWYHLAHQIASQLYVDQAISKTINLVKTAPPDDVFTTYLVAWLSGLKGVTIYRDESKSVQVINFGIKSSREPSNGDSSRRRKRMVLPRRTLTKEELSMDPVIGKLVNTVEVSENVVVMDLDKNSTCETCDL